mmetsp:Transcript_22722/g.59900  ORF Transcript_22722/g.59900 Transcript_22722/m.59900 type:complete len:260 (-) Transcript_22722:330-1109(-)
MIQSTLQESGAGHTEAAFAGGVVTLMVKNVPSAYTWKALLADIGQHCDIRYCDMLHLPVHTKRRCNVGYAFISFTHALAAQKCRTAMSGRSWSLTQKNKACVICDAHLQGISANLANFVLGNEKSRCLSLDVPMVFSRGQPLHLADAVREYCDEAVVREMWRKCSDVGRGDLEAHADARGASPTPVRRNRHGAGCEKTCVVDHGFRSTSALASERCQSMGVPESETSSDKANQPQAERMLRLQSDALQGQLRVALRISL